MTVQRHLKVFCGLWCLVVCLFAAQGWAQTVLFNPDDYEAPQVWGELNGWQPAGAGSVTASNARITTDQVYGDQIHSYAVDFDNGSLDVDLNVTQSEIWVPVTALPASGVDALQFAMRAPAGTKIQFIAQVGADAFATPILEQGEDDAWQDVTIRLSRFSPALDITAGGSLEHLYFKLFGAGAPGEGIAGLTGTVYLSSFTLVASASATVLFEPSDFSQGAWGEMNTWQPLGAGSMTVTNSRITSQPAYMDESMSFALDFDSGSMNDPLNLSQGKVWSPATSLPTQGVNALQFAMRAPAGTTFLLYFCMTDGSSPATPMLTQTNDNQWQQFTIALEDLSIPLTESKLAEYAGYGVKNQNFDYKVFGAGAAPGVPVGLSGTLCLSSIKMLQYEFPEEPDLAEVMTAANKTITVDGDASDWDLSASQPIHITNAFPKVEGQALELDIRCAWDQTYLYFLIEEGGNVSAQNEATTVADYTTNGSSTGPWWFDGVGLWISLDPPSSAYGFNPWFGLSSSGLSGLVAARINADDSALDTASLAGASVATSGSFAQRDRLVEARVAWSSLASAVDSTYQPQGGLLSAIKQGYKIGVNPLIIENGPYNQSFMNGTASVPPVGNDADSRNIVLSDANGSLNAARPIWTLLD